MAVSSSSNKSVNINHPNAAFEVSGSNYLRLNENGAVLIGNETTVPESVVTTGASAEYKGMLIFNTSLNRLQYWDGETWQILSIETDNSDSLILWSLMF